jgi:hypothetical protein
MPSLAFISPLSTAYPGVSWPKRALLPETDSSSGRIEGLTLAISVRRIENVETTPFDIPHF